MNVRIFVVGVMGCMCTKTGPWFILSSKGVEGCHSCSHAGIKLLMCGAGLVSPSSGKQCQRCWKLESRAKTLTTLLPCFYWTLISVQSSFCHFPSALLQFSWLLFFFQPIHLYILEALFQSKHFNGLLARRPPWEQEIVFFSDIFISFFVFWGNAWCHG